MRLLHLILFSHLAPSTTLPMQCSDNWLSTERSHLSQVWSDYKHSKEQKKLDFRICREKATSQRIAANLRAEFVHECVRERRKSESDS